jgi:hypothetical protein
VAGITGGHWRAVLRSARAAAKVIDMSWLRCGAGLVSLLVAALVVGACGDSDSDSNGTSQRSTVDASELEREIEQNLSSKTIEVKSVSCPDDVKSETGAKFTCSAKFDAGGSAKVAVTETRAPNQFSYDFKPGTVVLAGAAVDQELERDLEAKGAPGATVNCPSEIKVEKGTTVTCPVTGAGGGVGNVSFEFSDAVGSIDATSVDTGS